MVVLMLGAGLCLLLLLLSLAVRLRLGIPLVYVLLMLTVFHGWYQPTRRWRTASFSSWSAQPPSLGW